MWRFPNVANARVYPKAPGQPWAANPSGRRELYGVFLDGITSSRRRVSLFFLDLRAALLLIRESAEEAAPAWLPAEREYCTGQGGPKWISTLRHIAWTGATGRGIRGTGFLTR
jgi:hypothetical protein